MAIQLPPIPNNPITDVFVWRDWFFAVSQLLVQQASIAWTSIDFTGSNLLNIQTRQHNALQSIQGGIASQYYHLTAAEYTTLQAFPTFPLTVPNGGTGNTSFTSGDYLKGNGTGAITTQVIPIPVTDGGSGATTLTGYVYGNGTGAFTASTTIPTSAVNLKYGAFHDTTTQTAAVINTAYAVTFNTTDLSNGASIGSPTSRIVVTTAGKYNFQFSAQLHKTNASVGYIYIWARVNGTDIADSASKISINGSQAETIAAWNFVLNMAANDYFELMWSADHVNCQLLSGAASSPVPAIPSVILTATQVA